MEIKLLGDKVLVERIHEQEEYSLSGGIFIKNPDNRGRSNEGYVRAVGEGRVHRRTGVILPMEVRVGDYVLFENGLRENVKIDDVEYIIMEEEKHIIGILESSQKAS
jgi:chaperonin GroES